MHPRIETHRYLHERTMTDVIDRPLSLRNNAIPQRTARYAGVVCDRANCHDTREASMPAASVNKPAPGPGQT